VRPSFAAVLLLATSLAGSWVAGCGSSGKEDSARADGGGADGPATTSSSGGSSGGDAGDDGGIEVAGDAGYPAFTPEMPQVVDQGGPVLTAPKIVTVTFAGDPNAPTIQSFDDAIGASSYWTVLAEYGVGPAISAAADHVVVQTALTTGIDVSDIDTWVQTQIDGAPADGWPAPDTQTLYAVYVPVSVAPTSGGQDACTASGEGYHYELNSPASGNGVSYAQILEGCYIDDQVPLLTDLMETASHELAEASTDPFPDSNPAYYGFDTDHIAWEEWNDWQDELADACEYFDEGYFQGGSDLPYMLSRLWSNASARAGHDPCVPAPAGAYTNVSPLDLAGITVTAWDGNTTSSGANEYTSLATRGWRIGVGATAKVKVGFYSDGPAAPWTVQAVEGDCCTPGWPSVLTVSPASFSGSNGDVVELTITVNKAPSPGTAALLTFQSDAGGGIHHYMPVIVGTY